MRLGGRGSKSPGWGISVPDMASTSDLRRLSVSPFAREYADLPAPPTTFD
jgi:hypothetical protein